MRGPVINIKKIGNLMMETTSRQKTWLSGEKGRISGGLKKRTTAVESVGSDRKGGVQ